MESLPNTKISDLEKLLLEAMRQPAKGVVTTKPQGGLKLKPNPDTQKRERISIRISANNKLRLQQKAREMGLPYQTLAGSILRQYVMGELQHKR